MVSLNIVFPPAKIKGSYEPQLGKSGLYYCGRNVMKGHNFPGGDDMCDGTCGPDNGPNCHSCRTLATKKMDRLNKKLIFQGYSGMIYCGKEIITYKGDKEKYCGPDNGVPCDKCFCLTYLDE